MRGVNKLKSTTANRAAIGVGSQDRWPETRIPVRAHRLDKVIPPRGLDDGPRVVKKIPFLLRASSGKIRGRRRIFFGVMKG
jgi:hypothetical protein